jgi:hypothetical protein
MNCDVKNVIKITQGSREDVLVRLSDPRTGERFDLTPFNAFKACFITGSGTKIEKTITAPVTPALGVVEFTLDSVDTAQFDEDMRDFELEFTYTTGTNKHIVMMNNALEITERICG